MTTILLLIIVILVLAIFFINLFLLFKQKSNHLDKVPENLYQFHISLKSSIERVEKLLQEESQRNRQEMSENINKSLKYFSESFTQSNTHNQQTLNQLISQKFNDLQSAIGKHLVEMRNTVDEKLQTTLEKRLGESFKQVSERLEQVHKGLGEMQHIATGVGDLKKVLANVKTRGVLGEFQLANILEGMLTPEQYARNVAPKKGSQANVEFAIKLPGEGKEEVWLPIDSKFPIESYEALLNAYDLSDKKEIESAQKALLKNIDLFAQTISSKYIDPPHTTDFAIMFLPIEGLYAEVLKYPGLFESLQRKYHITITGPTTLSALLNSLQMGFRTLVVQKRSSEVWKILESVKTEFSKFADQLEKVDKQLTTASSSLNELRSTRTKVMSRKLDEVGALEHKDSNSLNSPNPSLLDISKK